MLFQKKKYTGICIFVLCCLLLEIASSQVYNIASNTNKTFFQPWVYNKVAAHITHQQNYYNNYNFLISHVHSIFSYVHVHVPKKLTTFHQQVLPNTNVNLTVISRTTYVYRLSCIDKRLNKIKINFCARCTCTIHQ